MGYLSTFHIKKEMKPSQLVITKSHIYMQLNLKKVLEYSMEFIETAWVEYMLIVTSNNHSIWN